MTKYFYFIAGGITSVAADYLATDIKVAIGGFLVSLMIIRVGEILGAALERS